MTTATTKQDLALVHVYAFTTLGEEPEPLVSVHTSVDELYADMRYDLGQLRGNLDTSDVSDDDLAEALEDEGGWAVKVFSTIIDIAALVRTPSRNGSA